MATENQIALAQLDARALADAEAHLAMLEARPTCTDPEAERCRKMALGATRGDVRGLRLKCEHWSRIGALRVCPFESMERRGIPRAVATLVADAFAVAHEPSDVWAALRLLDTLAVHERIDAPRNLAGYLSGRHFVPWFEGAHDMPEDLAGNLEELRNLAHAYRGRS